MTIAEDMRETFRALHVPGQPLLMPNPWDAGSARLLATAGFRALATTSSGYAATLGRPDGSVSRDEALTHARNMVAAVDVPVSADFENGFAEAPDDVYDSVSQAAAVGLAGCSIEDFTGDEQEPIYEIGRAAERVAAAAQAAKDSGSGFVLTARAENFLHGNPDLSDSIARLRAYQRAGADVLYTPGLTSIDEINRVLDSVERPLNVLTMPGVPPVPELAQAGVARISVGGSFNRAAIAALTRAGRELLEDGTYGFLADASEGRAHAIAAFHAD